MTLYIVEKLQTKENDAMMS